MIVIKGGSGKSSLINAILGVMLRCSGSLEIDTRVACVSHDNWILNTTLLANILFEQDYGTSKYFQVLTASRLANDPKALPDGDLTKIGERDINLSGGQSARVANTRALFRTAVAQTRLLVLYDHYDLLGQADHVVMMRDGVIATQGTYDEVLRQFPNPAYYSASVEGGKKIQSFGNEPVV
uniref:ABC transporter domain-containing protein n=1 Tax=Peronospora matthiolae TaxID=2874970 RepID=A0AAV1T5L9_9STRA